MTTLFLRTDVVNKSIPLVYIDLIDLDEYQEVFDLMKMGNFKVIHFRRENLVNLMVANSKPYLVNIQDSVSKMILIEKSQEELKKKLLNRGIPVLDVTQEEKNKWNRIAEFLGVNSIKYKKEIKPVNPKKVIKNWDDFHKSLQYTQFAHMV